MFMCNKADGEAHHTKVTHDLINYSRGRNKIGLLLHYCSVSKKLQIDYFGEKNIYVPGDRVATVAATMASFIIFLYFTTSSSTCVFNLMKQYNFTSVAPLLFSFTPPQSPPPRAPRSTSRRSSGSYASPSSRRRTR